MHVMSKMKNTYGPKMISIQYSLGMKHYACEEEVRYLLHCFKVIIIPFPQKCLLRCDTSHT